MSNFEYTVVSRPLDDAYATAYITQLRLPDDTILDFRGKITVGYWVNRGSFDRFDYEYIVDTESSWSDIQTISIKDGAALYTSPNPTTSTTPLPTEPPRVSTWYSNTQTTITAVPYVSMIIIMACIIVLTIGIIVTLVVVLLFRKHPKTNELQLQQS